MLDTGIISPYDTGIRAVSVNTAKKALNLYIYMVLTRFLGVGLFQKLFYSYFRLVFK